MFIAPNCLTDRWLPQANDRNFRLSGRLVLAKEQPVIDEPRRFNVREDYVRDLAAQTGATEDQIRSIIQLVGVERSSIIREARLLVRSNKPQ